MKRGELKENREIKHNNGRERGKDREREREKEGRKTTH